MIVYTIREAGERTLRLNEDCSVLKSNGREIGEWIGVLK